MGHAWLEVRNFEAAQACFERLCQDNQAPAVALIRLSEIYIRRRRLEDAAQIAERALSVYGPEDGVLLARGNVHRQIGQLDLAEKLFHILIARPNADPSVRAVAGYELAGLYDHTGKYDLAMSALLEAKALQRRSSAQPLKIMQQKQKRMKEMQQGASAEAVQRWRKSGLTDLQPARRLALLCGHARSGTTLLEYVIDAHPGVTSAEESMVFHNKAYFPLGQVVSSNTTFVSALDWLARNRPVHSRSRSSAASGKASSSTPTRRWTSGSARRRRRGTRPTGCRPFPAKAGIRSSASTARWNRGSTRLGSRERSSR